MSTSPCRKTGGGRDILAGGEYGHLHELLSTFEGSHVGSPLPFARCFPLCFPLRTLCGLNRKGRTDGGRDQNRDGERKYGKGGGRERRREGGMEGGITNM